MRIKHAPAENAEQIVINGLKSQDNQISYRVYALVYFSIQVGVILCAILGFKTARCSCVSKLEVVMLTWAYRW